MQRIFTRTFNTINYVAGGRINNLFIGKKVILSLFNKINRLSASLAGKSLYRYKQSFSLVSLAMYMMISALAVSITLGAISIIDNAKIARTIDEIEYYQKANSEFIVRYSALPGLVPYSECERFADFNDVCRNQNDINLTTSENVYKSTTNDCHHNMGCIIETNGKAGSEDVIRNFLLPMRYLKTAGLIDTIRIGLETELSADEDYSDKVWAKSRIDKDVYINIYNYYNPTRNTSKPFLFTGQTIFGHTINSDTSFDHYDKLAKSNDQYLLYLKKSSNPRGAISAKIAHKIDRKFDDGKPMTGRLTTFSTSSFTDDFENSEYAGCITTQPNNKDHLDDISYNIGKSNSGYCNIAYRLQNFLSAVVEGSKTNSGGTTAKGDPIDETILPGYDIEHTYSDGSKKTIRPTTCDCNQESKTLSCSYQDGTNRSFYPLGDDACTYDNATGKQTCTYENGTQCTVELTQTDFQNNCTVKNSLMTCRYDNTGAIPDTRTYTTTKKFCTQNLIGTTCERGTIFNCDTFNNNIVGNCEPTEVRQCSNNTPGEACDTTGDLNYNCRLFDNKIVDCQAYADNQECTSDSGTCTTGNTYSCTTLNGEIKSGTCKPIIHRFCTSDDGTSPDAPTCAAIPTDTSYKYVCKFYGDEKQSCWETVVRTQTCTNNTAGSHCMGGVSDTYTGYYSCSAVNGIIVGTCDQYVGKYCNNNAGECDISGDAYYCPEVLNNIISGTCKAVTYKYCTESATDLGDYNCENLPYDHHYEYYCKFLGDEKQSCEEKNIELLNCSNNSLHTSCIPVDEYECRCETIDGYIVEECFCERQ